MERQTPKWRELYEGLRTLEAKAKAAREKAGLTYSRHGVAEEAGHPFLDRRLNTWLHDDLAKVRVPSPVSTERLLDVIRVWSRWAGVPDHQRYWRTLMDDAQPVRPRRPRPGADDGADPEDPHGVLRGHEVWIEQYVLPARLHDRETELRELADFCTAEAGESAEAAENADAVPQYVWWQAGPWAGKSALLAELVLRRRPAGVEFVSCFLSARLGNNDRESFLQTVNRQLAVRAGRDPMSYGGHAHEFPGLFTLAAEKCRDRGRRLVLVVDGLDEDRGSGPEGPSVAALLPRILPAGMRVIVTGRPNPPVPGGVPEGHPLCEPGTVRLLAPSPFASDISARARTELQKLLRGGPVGRDVVGLLAVSQGGLTTDDLVRLAGAMPYEVDGLLSGVTGRSFVPADGERARPPERAGDGPRTRVLGHTELHREALTGLGAVAVARYEARLHDWAQEYRAEGWPPGTPAYLLYDYPRMLRRTDGGTDRLAALVLDPRRQRALLDRASVDAAVSEIELASRLVERDSPDDLAARAALAVSRELLTHSARGLPAAVPVAFARLGLGQRATDLALTSPHPEDKAVRLAEVARALVGVDGERAVTAASEAARWARRARRESAPWNGDEADAEVAAAEAAVALIATGQEREGRDLLGTLRSDTLFDDGVFPCATTARAAEAARPWNPRLAQELFDRAETLADELVNERLEDAGAPVSAWSAIAEAAGSADPVRAARMRARIGEYVRGAPAYLEWVTAQAKAAQVLADASPNEAAALARQAAGTLGAVLRVADEVSSRDTLHLSAYPEVMLTEVAYALVATGGVDEARRLVEAVPEHLTRGWFGREVCAGARAAIEGVPRGGRITRPEELAGEACRLAEQGRAGEASRRLDEALNAFAGAHRDGPWRSRLVMLAGAFATAGMPEDGARLARIGTTPVERVKALAAVAVASADAGDLPLARRLADEAADLASEVEEAESATARPVILRSNAARAREAAAQALAHAGERERALRLMAEPARAEGTAHRSTVLVAAGLRRHDPATAAELVDRERVRLMARTSERSGIRGCISALGHLLQAIGDADRACEGRLRDALAEVWALGGAPGGPGCEWEDLFMAVIVEGGDQRQKALRLLHAWEDDNHEAPLWELTAGLALAYAALGDHYAADRVAEGHNVPRSRAEAYVAVAGYLVGAPENAYLGTGGVDTVFTEMLRTLAVSRLPHDTRAPGVVDRARGLVAEALTDGGWDHALPLLARIAPEAVERVRDVVFGHLDLEAGSTGIPVAGAPMSL